MAAKQLERLAKKAEKEEKAEKNKLKLVCCVATGWYCSMGC